MYEWTIRCLQIYTALKRGLDYGILKRDHGYYSLNVDPDMLYKAPNMPPLEQGRRRRRRRRRRGRSQRRGRRGRGRRRRRGRGRGRRRRGRRSRGRGRGRSRRRESPPPVRARSLAARCDRCSSRKRTEDTLRKTPVESLRKDMTYLYKKGPNQTPSRQSRSRDRSQTHSRSVSSDKEMIDERDQA